MQDFELLILFIGSEDEWGMKQEGECLYFNRYSCRVSVFGAGDRLEKEGEKMCSRSGGIR
jgi:hypothetical protein